MPRRLVQHDVFIGIGSNIGDRLGNLLAAARALQTTATLVAASPVYQSSPVGIADQPDFLNAVLRIRTPLPPQDLLRALKQREADMGRTAQVPNGPRIIDFDILLYDDVVLHDDAAGLTIPHPRMHERAFVLRPLADLDSARVHPVLGQTVDQLLLLTSDQRIERADAETATLRDVVALHQPSHG